MCVVETSYNMSINNISNLSQHEMNKQGMSGIQFRALLNNLGTLIDDLVYLEIGVFSGSSFFSLLKNNNIKGI
jgi:hypothetical protein